VVSPDVYVRAMGAVTNKRNQYYGGDGW